MTAKMTRRSNLISSLDARVDDVLEASILTISEGLGWKVGCVDSAHVRQTRTTAATRALPRRAWSKDYWRGAASAFSFWCTERTWACVASREPELSIT